ncbi:hypothetical protein [Clostridium sp.]|uniref:hypothetical protein n=1 Tax=Clostridium sp. TaxID=1506 RepID=UPI002FCC4D10
MRYRVNLNLKEVKRLGMVFEDIYNEYIEKNYDFKELCFNNLVLNNKRNTTDLANKLIKVMEYLHHLHQKYLADNNNRYSISVNELRVKREEYSVHLSNLNSMLRKLKSFKVAYVDLDYIKDLEDQVDNLNSAIAILDSIEDELMNKEVINIEKIMEFILE